MKVSEIEIAQEIWKLKYKHPKDESPEDSQLRVAMALARDREQADRFASILTTYEFLPGGRILSGAGTDRRVTMQNCYVMGTIPDSMDGIFQILKESALTMQQGGGIGMDFSTIRPKGAPVVQVGSDASGPCSFMDCWDSMCKTIMSAGSRRGAMMGTMRCDHPDIFEFVDTKKSGTRWKNFNISVLCTDDFMQAVKNGADFDLKFAGKFYRSIQARHLWAKIMNNTYEFADPGVIFIDRMNQENNLNYCETIAATNPCVPAGTKILTKLGWWPIDELVGQNVEIWNGQNWSEVVPQITGQFQSLLTVTLSDGRELTCTPAHKFITNTLGRIEAKDLQVGQKLCKGSWPVIEGTHEHPKAYQQGFFSGDGYSVNGIRDYIDLHGEKKKLEQFFTNVKSANTYAISGGYEGTNIAATKRVLYFGQNNFNSKTFVPNADWTVQSRLSWLAGVFDADGCAVFSNNSIILQLSSKNKKFLQNVQLLLNTLGASGFLSPMKDCWRLGISANNLSRLKALGFSTRRLNIQNSFPQRETARFVYVKSVKALDKIADKVFCFTEIKNHTGCFDGILTGQCGEQPLPPYGNCLLGSVNLTQFVRNPFTKNCEFDFKRLVEVTSIAVELLDRVVDVSNYPLEQQKKEAESKRRIGLGITGLASAFAMMRLKYSSETAVKLTDQIMSVLTITAYNKSILLAQEHGHFPLYMDSRNGFAYKKLKNTCRRRNSHLISIAPTGTISLYAGNVSSGIEPIFALQYDRKVLMPNGSHETHQVMDYAVAEWERRYGLEPLPDYFETVDDLPIIAHLNIQQIAQQWCDSSVSKTINLPEGISREGFEGVYLKAYGLGLKGCTTFRPNSTTGSILSVKEPPAIKKQDMQQKDIQIKIMLEEPPTATPTPRPEGLTGTTYKLKFGDTPALYITINNLDGLPFEIFFNSKNMEHYAWALALSRMISAVWRKGGDTSFVIEELQSVFDPRGGAWIGGRYVPSIVAAIGDVAQRHIAEIGTTLPATVGGVVQRPENVPPQRPELQREALLIHKPSTHIQCPKCGALALEKKEGCEQCTACDYSKC